MTVVTCIVLLICMTIVNGCASGEKTRGPTGSPPQVSSGPIEQAGAAPENERFQLLEVERFSLGEEKLRLDYRVTNIFPCDIWVCTSYSYISDQDSEWSVETEIIEGTFWIRRRGHLEDDGSLYINSMARKAVYCRLPAGQSRCDTVLLPLPVASRPFLRAGQLPIWPIALTRVVLEVGYFKDDLPAFLSQWQGGARMLPERPDRPSSGDAACALITHFPRRDRWEGLDWEQAVQVVVPDVNVPGKWDKPPAQN